MFVGNDIRNWIMAEALKYSQNHKLPIHFVIGDNSLSVCTDTKSLEMKKISFQKKIVSMFLIINMN